MKVRAVAFVISGLLVQAISGIYLNRPSTRAEVISDGIGLTCDNLGRAEENLALTANGYPSRYNGLESGLINAAEAANDYILSLATDYNPEDTKNLNYGGPFIVTSWSPIVPTGITATAENLVYEGPLTVSGNMPFLGTVVFEGALPTSGTGLVSFGAGDGVIGINKEIEGAPGSNSGFGYNSVQPGNLGYLEGLSDGINAGAALTDELNGIGLVDGLERGYISGVNNMFGIANNVNQGIACPIGINNGISRANLI